MVLRCDKPGCLVVLREDERQKHEDEPELEFEGRKLFLTCPACGHRNELKHGGADEHSPSPPRP